MKLWWGVLISIGNLFGPKGTILGFYPPDSAQRIGFDVGKLLWFWLAAWLIRRGLKERANKTPPPA